MARSSLLANAPADRMLTFFFYWSVRGDPPALSSEEEERLAAVWELDPSFRSVKLLLTFETLSDLGINPRGKHY